NPTDQNLHEIEKSVGKLFIQLVVAACIGASFEAWGPAALAFALTGQLFDIGMNFDVFLGRLQSVLTWAFHDPLILDLDNDGVEVSALAGSTVDFDFDGDGFAERTGWVSSDDGILVYDKNSNGNVDSVAELFGSKTQ